MLPGKHPDGFEDFIFAHGYFSRSGFFDLWIFRTPDFWVDFWVSRLLGLWTAEPPDFWISGFSALGFSGKTKATQVWVAPIQNLFLKMPNA
jgi:hypothetical protein